MPAGPADTSALRQAIAATALRQVGKPYVWGAAGPGSFDCSGLVEFSYAEHGITIPHNSVLQWDACQHVPAPDVADPVFLLFDQDGPQHEAMYVGAGNVVVAPHTGALVEVVAMSSFAGRHAFGSFLGTSSTPTPPPPSSLSSSTGAIVAGSGVGCGVFVLAWVLVVLCALALAGYAIAAGSVA